MDWKQMLLSSINTESIAKFAYLQIKRKIVDDFIAEYNAKNGTLEEMGKARAALEHTLDGYQDFILDFAKSAMEKKEEKK